MSQAELLDLICDAAAELGGELLVLVAPPAIASPEGGLVSLDCNRLVCVGVVPSPLARPMLHAWDARDGSLELVSSREGEQVAIPIYHRGRAQ